SAAFGIVSGAVGVVLVVLTRSVVWFAAGFLGGQVAALIWLLVRAPADVRRGAPPRAGDLLRLARATLPFAVAFVALTVHYKVDILLLERLRTTGEVGLYAAAYKFIDVFHALVLVAVGAMYPRLSRAAVRKRGDDGRWAATRAAELLLLGAVPVGAGLWLLREPMVALLFGDGYVGAVPVLALLAPVLPALAVNLCGGYVLGAERRMGSVAVLYGAGVSLKIALALWAIPRWGAVGAAGAVLASETCVAFVMVAVLGRLAGAAPGKRSVALAGGAAGLAAITAWWMSPLGAPATALTYLVAAAVLYRLSGALSHEERSAVLEALVPARGHGAAAVGGLP
ncbi:MAG TPA: polysaccharide biosynthesis C-terminal domain-containing protein, partial [Candidatus Thermoplasmatota archaeon]